MNNNYTNKDTEDIGKECWDIIMGYKKDLELTEFKEDTCYERYSFGKIIKYLKLYDKRYKNGNVKSITVQQCSNIGKTLPNSKKEIFRFSNKFDIIKGKYKTNPRNNIIIHRYYSSEETY